MSVEPTVTERDGSARFADDVALAGTDRVTGSRRAVDARWIGPLERVDDGETRSFVSMQVSAPEGR